MTVRRLRAVVSSVLPLPAILWLSGCFQYYPLAPDVVPAPGTKVQATFSSPSSFDLGPETLRDVTRVEGTLMQGGADTLGVWAKWFYRDQGSRVEGYDAQYTLQRSTVSQLSVWRVSVQRTIVASLVFGGAITALSVLGLNGAFGGTGGGTNRQPF
jgi:hypothetical protein